MEPRTRSYSNEVLERTPERVTRLLCGLGASPQARARLAEAGFGSEELAEGRTLLLDCLASTLEGTPAARPGPMARDFLREVRRLLDRTRIALSRRHPGALAYLVPDLAAFTTLAGATTVLALYLQRLEVLEQGSDPDRAACRAEDREAVELLARRHIDRAERDRMRARLETLLALPPERLPDPLADPQSRRQRLTALKLWYEEWAEAAKQALSQRNQRMRLGLARRRTGKKQVQDPAAPAAHHPRTTKTTEKPRRNAED